MPDLRDEIKDFLDRPDLSDSLSELFCALLNWGAPAGGPLAITVHEAPTAGNGEIQLSFSPVAQLSGLPVLYTRWPGERLPGVVQRREVYRKIAPRFLEHLIVYHAPAANQLAFVWARPRRDNQIELRTLPYQPGLPARTTLEQIKQLAFNWDELGLLGDPGITRVSAKMNAAFDVEAVTRDFFIKYRQLFRELEESLPVQPELTPEKRRLYTQKFFNRLMFLMFLERKGWLSFNGQPDYLRALFQDYAHSPEYRSSSANFHRTRLTTLFFLTLNNPADQNHTQNLEYAIFRRLVGSAPYLNGGLFEKDGDDELYFFPDDLIARALSELFYAYNFTITESTPLDIEVAIDPEMLGKIFEELVTGRHESGSYYTPRPVVVFMCREALKGYLKDACPGEPHAALEALVEQRDPSGLSDPACVRFALQSVKVCDPACGSGAYLLGMLHELVDLRAAVGPDGHLLYDTKLNIIQNNLYGVDKDPFAVNIARLRLWLSLVVDDPRNPLTDPSLDVSLPNLDFKIEAGDSLTAPDPSGGLELGLRAFLVGQYLQAKQDYLRSHGKDKPALKKVVLDLKTQIQSLSGRAARADEFDWAVEFAEVFLKPGAETTLSGGMAAVLNQTGQMELTAGDLHGPGGFDIVLANPPYIRQEVITAEMGAAYKQHLTRLYPRAYVGTADLYVAFYARAQQLLRQGGLACFISSNKWLRAGYGEKLRQWLLDEQAFHLVVDFGELPVFQAAATFPAIFLWQKQPRGHTASFWAVVKDLQACYEEGILAHIRRLGTAVPAGQFGAGKARLARSDSADLRRKMEASGQPLGELVDHQIYYGIKTGLNEAFLIDRPTRDALIQSDPRSAEIIKPLLAGDDVRHYEAHFRETYLIWTYIGVPIQEYPAVWRHLLQHQDKAEKRWDKGDHWWELRSCDYYNSFMNPKILYPDIAKETRFCIVEQEIFCLNTTYFLPLSDYYLLAILNSTFPFEYLKITGAILGDEERGGRVRCFSQYMETLPIPIGSRDDCDISSRLAKNVHQIHKNRRNLVERFLTDVGISPARSTSRNPLEQPWLLTPAEFKRRAPRAAPALFSLARDETAALTAQIESLESEINQRVAGLYGLG